MIMLSIKKWMKEFGADAEKIISVIAAWLVMMTAGGAAMNNKEQ